MISTWWLYGAAFVLWLLHGYLLYRAWGRFRPRIAFFHGVLLAGLGLALARFGVPGWALTAAGVAVGAGGALGHRLVPGLWVGAIIAPVSFTLGAQLGALALGLVKPSRLG